MEELSFIVPGVPKGKGRPRFTRDGHAYTDKNTTIYENLVKSQFCAKYPGWIPTDKCIGMEIYAYFPAPKSTPKKALHYVADELLRYGKKPDFDNLDKIICDALNEIVYRDDKQVTDHAVKKRYSLQPRTEIIIKLLDDVEGWDEVLK